MPNWFLDKTCKKGLKIENVNITIKFWILNLLNFWIKLMQKEHFRTKTNENYHRIVHIQINLDYKFQLQQFWFLEPILKKANFRLKSEKNEHYYWIFCIEISRSTNFQLKPTVVIFWIKVIHKGYLFSV